MYANLRPVVIRNRQDRTRIARSNEVIGYTPGRFGNFTLRNAQGEEYRVPTDDPSVLNRHEIIKCLGVA